MRHLFVANTHQPILFFTARGMVYRIKCWQIPDASSTGRGKPAVQLIPALSPDDEIAALPDFTAVFHVEQVVVPGLDAEQRHLVRVVAK